MQPSSQLIDNRDRIEQEKAQRVRAALLALLHAWCDYTDLPSPVLTKQELERQAFEARKERR